MYGRRPRCKRNRTIAKRSGAVMYTACHRLEDCLCRDAAGMAAGPDVIRGSGPKQKHAFKYRVTHHGFSGRPRKLTAHQRQEALASAAGETQADVARTYAVDPTTIGRLPGGCLSQRGAKYRGRSVDRISRSERCD
jgi:hypothetical protein